MEEIKKIFLIADKKERYDKFVFWISSVIFQNKISILEYSIFSEKRKIRRNNKKLVAIIIYSKDPESSAFRGPAMKVKIFENQNDKSWEIDLIFIDVTSKTIDSCKNLDFVKFINEERAKIMRDFICK